jgi:hypothetical protein
MITFLFCFCCNRRVKIMVKAVHKIAMRLAIGIAAARPRSDLAEMTSDSALVFASASLSSARQSR